MNDEIKYFFQQISVLEPIDKAVYYLQRQEYTLGLQLIEEIIREGINTLREIEKNSSYFKEIIDYNELTSCIGHIKILQDIMFSKEIECIENILLMHLKPVYHKYYSFIIRKEKWEQLTLAKYAQDTDTKEVLLHKNNKQYLLEAAVSGRLSIVIHLKNKVFHMDSISSPMLQSLQLAQSWYNPETERYIVYGFSFGRHIEALYHIDIDAKITIYESDINVIKIALGLSSPYFMQNNSNIKLIYDPAFKKLFSHLKNIKKNEKFFLHYPSVQCIEDDYYREALLAFAKAQSKNIETRL